MELPTRRETATFVVGYAVALVAIGALIAIALGRAVVPSLVAEFTDGRFLVTASFGVVIWMLVYPRSWPSTDRE